MAAYEEKCAEYRKRLKKSWDSVLTIIEEKSKISSDSSVTLLNQLETDVNIKYDEYVSLSHTYGDFLTATNTDCSLQEKANFQTQLEHDRAKVAEFCQLIAGVKEKLLECLMAKSNRSGLYQSEKSKASKASKVNSDLLATKYAEAEAARVRMEYAEKEAKILKQKAKLEESEQITLATASRQKLELVADLNVLSQQKEAAAAAAE